MATIMFIKSYSARKDSKGFMIQAPTINRKVSSTLEAPSVASTLNKEIPKILSNTKKKITKEPTTAKELTSIPTRCNICSPKKTEKVALSVRLPKQFFRKECTLLFL